MKKNGINRPNPTAASFDSSTETSRPRTRHAGDHPGDESAEHDVQPELCRGAASPNTSRAASRTASWLLASIERSSADHPIGAVRTGR